MCSCLLYTSSDSFVLHLFPDHPPAARWKLPEQQTGYGLDVYKRQVLCSGLEEVAENGWQIWANMRELFTPLAAYSFLIFNLLCAPCFAAMGAIKREMNSAKWTVFAIGYQCVFAYVIALIVYQLGMLFTGQGNIIGSIVAFALLALIIFLLVRPYKESNTLKTKVKV